MVSASSGREVVTSKRKRCGLCDEAGTVAGAEDSRDCYLGLLMRKAVNGGQQVTAPVLQVWGVMT